MSTAYVPAPIVTGPPVHCRLSVPGPGVRSIATVEIPDDVGVRVATIDANARGVVANVTAKRRLAVAGGGVGGGCVGVSQEPATIRTRATIAALRARTTLDARVRAARLTKSSNGRPLIDLTPAHGVICPGSDPNPPAASHGALQTRPLAVGLRLRTRNTPAVNGDRGAVTFTTALRWATSCQSGVRCRPGHRLRSRFTGGSYSLHSGPSR